MERIKSDDLFNDDKADLKPNEGILGFFGIYMAALTGIYLWAATYVDVDSTKQSGAIRPILHGPVSVWEAFSDITLNPGKVMAFGGFVVAQIFYLAFYIYIVRYISAMWSKNFIQEGDNVHFQIFQVSYSIMMGVFLLFPQAWYMGLIVLYLYVCIFLKSRKDKIKNRVNESDIFYLESEKIYEKTDAKPILDGIATARYTAIRFIHKNFWVKGLLFGGPFVVFVATCHALGVYGASNSALLYTGAYGGLSFAFAIITVVALFIRAKHTLPVMNQRIAKGDDEYFKHLAR